MPVVEITLAEGRSPEKIRALITFEGAVLLPKAKDEGATIVFGGGIPDMPDDLTGGYWVQPTIWTGLPETAAVVQEEIFGPCAPKRR